jgi:hypothetical protein
MRRLALLAGCALLSACTADDTVSRSSSPPTTPAPRIRLRALASLSIEVYGDADGDLCTLARRCVTVADIADVADLTAALRAAMQPLIDTDLADTRQIAVLGHDRLGCGEADRLLCGFADLADAADDATLAVPLRCEAADCPLDVPPFCP